MAGAWPGGLWKNADPLLVMRSGFFIDPVGYHDGMMTPMVILCPGQGAQVVGMGKAWAEGSTAARAVFERADEVLGDRLGSPLSSICFGTADGASERINRTDVSQPAIYVASMASWAGMCERQGVGPGEARLSATAGLSLGEYTALAIAGAMSFEDGLELVSLRGRAMQDAAEASAGGMVALIGADEAQAKAVCDRVLSGGVSEVLVCANFNAPGQIVLSGHKGACDRAASEATGMGLRATVLTVAGAFHSPLMAPAAERLRAALAKTVMKPARCPVMSNVSHLPHQADAEAIRAGLVGQLTSPVRWAESCAWLARESGPGGELRQGAEVEFHELAPGKTLAGLYRRIDKGVKVVTHDEP